MLGAAERQSLLASLDFQMAKEAQSQNTMLTVCFPAQFKGWHQGAILSSLFVFLENSEHT